MYHVLKYRISRQASKYTIMTRMVYSNNIISQCVFCQYQIKIIQMNQVDWCASPCTSADKKQSQSR